MVFNTLHSLCIVASRGREPPDNLQARRFHVRTQIRFVYPGAHAPGSPQRAHNGYPRAVTNRPSISCVPRLPMRTTLRMPTSCWSK